MSTQLIRITSEVEIPYLTYQGQAVLTFALIDKVHNRVEGTAKRNFASNRERFISQEDYFYITDSKSLDEMCIRDRPRRMAFGISLHLTHAIQFKNLILFVESSAW